MKTDLKTRLQSNLRSFWLFLHPPSFQIWTQLWLLFASFVPDFRRQQRANFPPTSLCPPLQKQQSKRQKHAAPAWCRSWPVGAVTSRRTRRLASLGTRKLHLSPSLIVTRVQLSGTGQGTFSFVTYHLKENPTCEHTSLKLSLADMGTYSLISKINGSTLKYLKSNFKRSQRSSALPAHQNGALLWSRGQQTSKQRQCLIWPSKSCFLQLHCSSSNFSPFISPLLTMIIRGK